MAPGVLSYKAKREEDDAFEPEDGLDEPREAQPAPSRSLRSRSRVDYTAQLAPDPEPLKQPSHPSRILNSGARMRAAARISASATQAIPTPQDASKSCGFLDVLPAELRNRIYELVLGNSTIHIYTDLIGWDSNFEVFNVPPAPNDERILRDFCSAEDEEESHIEKIQAQDPAEAHHDEHDKRHILCRGRGSATDAFALLQTCRQVHSEAALIPFLSNTFSFFDLITLDQFLRRLILKQARAIQHISFTINSDSSFPDPPITTD